MAHHPDLYTFGPSNSGELAAYPFCCRDYFVLLKSLGPIVSYVCSGCGETFHLACYYTGRGQGVCKKPTHRKVSKLGDFNNDHIEALRRGETVRIRPHGNSMLPRIKSGQLCVIQPIGDHELEKGDAVLCTVNGRRYLHKIYAIRGNQVQIGNNHGHVNGWTTKEKVYGLLAAVED